MKAITSCLIVFFLIAVCSGCNSETKNTPYFSEPNSAGECVKPYMQSDNSCCLDKNKNSECDRNEELVGQVEDFMSIADQKTSIPKYINYYSGQESMFVIGVKNLEDKELYYKVKSLVDCNKTTGKIQQYFSSIKDGCSNFAEVEVDQKAISYQQGCFKIKPSEVRTHGFGLVAPSENGIATIKISIIKYSDSECKESPATYDSQLIVIQPQMIE